MSEPTEASVRDELSSFLRQFFEQSPLLTRCKQPLARAVTDKFVAECTPDAITLNCPQCSRETTWKLERGGIRAEMPHDGIPREGFFFHTVYRCSDCETAEVDFWSHLLTHPKNAKAAAVLKSTEERRGYVVTSDHGFGGVEVIGVGALEVRKFGQAPPWSFAVSKRVSKALGESAALFSRALACHAQGYGIGAAAYLRRIVEDNTQAILDLVLQAAQLACDDEAIANVKAAMNAHPASDRLKLAAQRVPSRLKVGGRNPLDVLYGLLSVPLHSASEEESQEIASELLEVIEFLFEAVQESLEREREYTKRIKAAGARLDELRHEKKSTAGDSD